MRIGIDISVLNDRQKTGIAVYTYNLIDALLKINRGDKFVLFGIATFETFAYLKSLPFKNYPNVEMKIYRMPARFFRIGFLLWQKINWPSIESLTGEVDIFHSFNWYLPPQKKGKIVATVFDMTPFLYPQFHLGKTIQLDTIRLNRIKNNADLVITISQNSKKDLLKFTPKRSVEIIYPAVSDNFKFARFERSKVERILKKYNIKAGYFLSVATLEPRKNIERLIYAYLAGNFKEKLLLVGGKGWKSEPIIKLIKMHRDKIITTGFVPDEDLPYIFNQAQCLIYPSLYEGFGIPILEAMSCKTVVICSNTSSLKEAGGEAVLYVDPLNIKDITLALKKVVDEKLRDELIKKGLHQIEQFSWDKSARRLNQLYHAL